MLWHTIPHWVCNNVYACVCWHRMATVCLLPSYHFLRTCLCSRDKRLLQKPHLPSRGAVGALSAEGFLCKQLVLTSLCEMHRSRSDTVLFLFTWRVLEMWLKYEAIKHEQVAGILSELFLLFVFVPMITMKRKVYVKVKTGVISGWSGYVIGLVFML